MDDVVKDRRAYYGEDDDSDNPSFGHPREWSRRKYDINLDYYQHPDKRHDRSIRYSRAHDIYSLGCVLLEIGLWKPLDALVDIDDDDYDKTKREFQALSANLNGLVTLMVKVQSTNFAFQQGRINLQQCGEEMLGYQYQRENSDRSSKFVNLLLRNCGELGQMLCIASLHQYIMKFLC